VSDLDRTFVGGNPNPQKFGLALRFSFGERPDPEMIRPAAVILNREPLYVDSEGFERELIAATINPDGKRVVYVESRAKESGQFVDVSIKIHYLDRDGRTASIDIESYNPFFGCDVGLLDWLNDDYALLIYTEKHWTFAYRIGDQWPPQFVKIDRWWQIADNVLSYMAYKVDVVKRLRIPGLEAMVDISLADAERDWSLPPR
jgi:hypothetical protein